MRAINLKYHALAFITIAFWGVTFISTKILINVGLLPAQIFFLRGIIAYLGLWALSPIARHEVRLMSDSLRDELALLLLGISGGSLYFLTENTALALTQACNVSFLVCSAPLFTALMTYGASKILKGEMKEGLEDVRFGKHLLIGTILAIAGMVMVLFDGKSVSFSPKGDILAVCAALCWGVYSVFVGRLVTKYGSILVTRKVFFYGLITILPFLVGKDFDMSILLRPEVWGNLAFLGIIASLACFVAWNVVIHKIGNVTATNYVYLNPFFTLVAAVIILDERLTLVSAAGCLAIVLGVFIAGKRGNT